MLTPASFAAMHKAVAIGDSITYGMSASSPDKCWASLTVSMLEEAFHTEITLANRGICANILCVDSPVYPHAAHPSGIERIRTDILDEKPDLLFIAYGLNDSRGGTDPAVFRADYQKLLDTVRAESDPVMVALNLFCMEESFYHTCAPWDRSTFDTARQFNEIIRKLAEKNGLLYADVFSEQFGLPCTVCDDHCHPNDLGHRLVANRVFSTLTDALRG